MFTSQISGLYDNLAFVLPPTKHLGKINISQKSFLECPLLFYLVLTCFIFFFYFGFRCNAICHAVQGTFCMAITSAFISSPSY